MSFYVKTRRQFRRTVRTWFRCDECGGYGDYSIPTVQQADAFLRVLNRNHHCAGEVR